MSDLLVKEATLNEAQDRIPQVRRRPFKEAAVKELVQAGLNPLMARIYAARGIGLLTQIEPPLTALLNPNELLGIEAAATIIADALANQSRILIVADYDCDGATACAVAIRGLKLLGAKDHTVDFIVPDRFKLGYGLSPELVELAALRKPDLLITVDNGIASVAGVQRAKALGLKVVVTDHHLAGEHIAQPDAMVNPNQPGCRFGSKALAGVGVMFYTLLAVRALLRNQNKPEAKANLAQLLDLVALGTVADLVPLDINNRILVKHGFARMLAGQLQPGLRAILRTAGKATQTLQLRDLGFLVGPRLNAAGRLSDMSLGIRCLISDDEDEVADLAEQLNTINSERKELQQSMLEQAQLPEVQAASHSLTVFREDWHQGIVGLIASRLKDRWHCPSFALAPAEPGSDQLRGSGRSIPGVHLRDVLDLVAKQEPPMLEKFGGHAMAAGLTLNQKDLPRFQTAFNQAVETLVGTQLPGSVLWTDGPLFAGDLSVENARSTQNGIWGQQFEPPVFEVTGQVIKQTLVKEKHLKLRINIDGQVFDAIRFFYILPAPQTCRLIVSLNLDRFNGREQLSLIVSHISATEPFN
jgi:single-stranded-DNA-specific exonuclease